jgi:hypothetical protein
MYRIKFRRDVGGTWIINPVVTCLKRYATKAEAQTQAAKWKQVFPRNTYYIVKG